MNVVVFIGHKFEKYLLKASGVLFDVSIFWSSLTDRILKIFMCLKIYNHSCAHCGYNLGSNQNKRALKYAFISVAFFCSHWIRNKQHNLKVMCVSGKNKTNQNWVFVTNDLHYCDESWKLIFKYDSILSKLCDILVLVTLHILNALTC